MEGHSPKFEYWRDRYYRNYARKDQLRRLVKLEVLTPEEFKEITEEDY